MACFNPVNGEKKSYMVFFFVKKNFQKYIFNFDFFDVMDKMKNGRRSSLPFAMPYFSEFIPYTPECQAIWQVPRRIGWL